MKWSHPRASPHGATVTAIVSSLIIRFLWSLLECSYGVTAATTSSQNGLH